MKSSITKTLPHLTSPKIREEQKTAKISPPILGGARGGKFGFTLVELIVVISILAILGTIAFLSFGGFSSKARDGTRISDTSSLSKGLELYQVKSGYYPKPEGTTMSGIINGTVVAYKGEIQDQISSLTKISKTPKDPLSNNYYIYGTTLDYKQYQIATTLENAIAYNKINPITQTTYADGPSYQAKVTGNYKGLLKYTDTSSKTWLSNIPSLIYNSGADLLNPNTYYSIDKSTNLPYTIQNATNGNITADTIIKQITNNQSASLTGISLSGITTKEEVTSNSIVLLSLGFDLGTIEKTVINGPTIIGSHTIPIVSCATTPTFTNLGTPTTGTPTMQNQARTYSIIPGNCTYTCVNGYTGNDCNTPSIVIPSGINIITDQYLVALDNSDGHIVPDYNIGINQIYMTSPAKDGLRDYDHILYNYGFWGINDSTNKSVIFRLNQPRKISHIQIGFGNDTSRPTAVNLYSLSGSTWNYRWGSSITMTYPNLNITLTDELSTTWKIDFTGGTTPYYVDSNSFIVKLQ